MIIVIINGPARSGKTKIGNAIEKYLLETDMSFVRNTEYDGNFEKLFLPIEPDVLILEQINKFQK